MKKILIIVLFISFCNHALGQQKKQNANFTKEKLIGVWQRGSKIVGSALNQHFIFNKDGTFILNLDSEGDDARNLITLKGRYRLINNELYFTIVSKIYIEGELELGGLGFTSSIFQFGANSKINETKDPNPKEIPDPCFITVISQTNIKLNNQIYYKIK